MNELEIRAIKDIGDACLLLLKTFGNNGCLALLDLEARIDASQIPAELTEKLFGQAIYELWRCGCIIIKSGIGTQIDTVIIITEAGKIYMADFMPEILKDESLTKVIIYTERILLNMLKSLSWTSKSGLRLKLVMSQEVFDAIIEDLKNKRYLKEEEQDNIAMVSITNDGIEWLEKPS